MVLDQELLKDVQVRCGLNRWFSKKEWDVNTLLREVQPHVLHWSGTFQFNGDVWLFICPYHAVVAIDEATGMESNLITDQDVFQQIFIVHGFN